jgi:2-amino-4-hydroxy-6-hydroxymethyldihydropteridine diphosphokinase
MSHPHRIWLGLGANLGDPMRMLGETVRRFEEDARFADVRASRCWRGPYVGPRDPQPEYFNRCLVARTGLAPGEVHAVTRQLERESGRASSSHELPRVLDIDVLLFDTLVLEGPELVLPHPRMRERRFVLEPLAELDPDLELPPDGARVGDLLREPRVAGQELMVVAREGGPAGAAHRSPS